MTRIKAVDSPYALAFGEHGFLKTKAGLKKITRLKQTGDIKQGWVKL